MAEPLRKAQPGGYPLRREVIEHHQRQRILAGAARAIAERGYRGASVADIVKSAAIARARFYEIFSSKEDCYLALYDETVANVLAEVTAACGQAEDGLSERVRAGIGALLGTIEAEPERARSVIVEGPAVGPAINDRLEGTTAAFADLLRRHRPPTAGTELPASVEETVVGGLYWMLYYALLEGKPKQLRRLLPQLSDFAMIPFQGAEASGSVAT